MRKTTFLSIILGLLLVPVIANAQSVYSDTYVIPVVSHTSGPNGTWRSDVTITNFQTTDLTVQLILVESGEGNSDNIFPVTTDSIPAGSVTISPGNTVVLKDVVNGYRGRDNVAGALILGGNKPFAVTSRSYLQKPDGSVLGQTVNAIQNFFENSTGRSDNSQVAVIPGIANNAVTRSNIGFVAGAGSAGGATFAVEVTVKDARGVVLGKKLVIIPAGNFTQVQFSVASILNVAGTQFDTGSAEIRIVQGSGAVIPYASVIDNASGNAMYINGQFPANTPFAKTGFSLDLFRSLFH